MMQLSRTSFDALVEQAIAELRADCAQWLEEVPVMVEDRPSAADLRGMDVAEGEPLGLYVGASIEEGELSGMLPARVMIYRVPLMEACTSKGQLAREIRRTLLHEFGHHAGMDEDELERHGMGDMENADDTLDWDVDP